MVALRKLTYLLLVKPVAIFHEYYPADWENPRSEQNNGQRFQLHPTA